MVVGTRLAAAVPIGPPSIAVFASAAPGANTTLMSCTPSAFDAAVATSGTVHFGLDCPNLVPTRTVAVPMTKVLDIEADGHQVVLNGAGKRLFSVSGGQLTVRG